MSEINLTKHLIGLTGEYFVAGMMSSKGWVASLTLKNYPSVDIFGMNPETGITVNIQVKTIKKGTNYPIGLTHQTIQKAYEKITCPFVFVHIDKNDKISYFIISRADLIKIILKSNDDYLKQTRQIPVKESNPVGIPIKYLQPFENKWDDIWKK